MGEVTGAGICSVEACCNALRVVGRPRKIARGREMCKVHYGRLLATGDEFKARCACGCGELIAVYTSEDSDVYSSGHDVSPKDRKSGPCAVDGCFKPLEARGYCMTHYHRNRKYGSPLKAKCSCTCGELVDLSVDHVGRAFLNDQHKALGVNRGAAVARWSKVFNDPNTRVGELRELAFSGLRRCLECSEIQSIEDFSGQARCPNCRNKAAVVKKTASAKRVLYLVENSVAPPDLSKTQVKDLNWLLAQSSLHWCGKCRKVKNGDEFAKRINSDKPLEDSRLNHLRVENRWVSSCNDCMRGIVANWRLKAIHERQCVVCGDQFQTSRHDATCCSTECTSVVGYKARSEAAADRRPSGYEDKPCQLEGCDNILPWNGNKYCGDECRSLARRSPLRRAIDDWNYDDMVAVLLESVTVGGEFSCWHWPNVNQDGYPSNGLHRSVCEVKYGSLLGEQAAHHECSNRSCVRPEHLVPVSHAANIAEMLARNGMLKYIETLKNVIATELRSDHPVLDRIEFR